MFDKGNSNTVDTFYYLGILVALIIVDVDLFFMMDNFKAVSEEYPIFYLVYPVLLGAHGWFDTDRITVSVLKNDSELKLELEEVESFRLPNEKGEYTVVFDIESDKGNAQYVGHIIIK